MTPALSEYADRVRDAAASGARLRVCGALSKPWMRMQTGVEGERLSLADYAGILDYKPAELVVTVRAGTRLADLDAMLAESGQMLAAEAPDFNGGSTIGGAVALGWQGSRGAFAGGLRDAVIGLTMINGRGELLRFGGEVMKNVAGFDVSRLMVGSQGRLGVIAELSLRVVPRPASEVTRHWPLPDLEASRAAVNRWLLAGFPVSAACFSEGVLRARFSGAPGMLQEVQRECGGEVGDNDFWSALRRLELPLFHHGWGDEKLFDGNGDICWTAHTRRQGRGPVVGLAEGPVDDKREPAIAALLGRVTAAFDPQAVFQRRAAA